MISKVDKLLSTGKAIEVDGWEDLKTTLLELSDKYETYTIGGALFSEEEIAERVKMLQEGYGDPMPKHISLVHSKFGMLLGITLQTKEDKEPYDLNSANGVFGYVWNINDDWCSEYGYSYYEDDKRVG